MGRDNNNKTAAKTKKTKTKTNNKKTKTKTQNEATTKTLFRKPDQTNNPTNSNKIK